MPSRGRVNKVTKPTAGPGARRGSRRSSLSAAAQEQLEQFAQKANSNVPHEAGPLDAAIHENEVDDNAFEDSVSLSAANMLANGAAITSVHASLPPLVSTDDDFQLDHQMPDGSSPEETAPEARTAADVAFAAYGDLVKIDSALCKKIAGEVALREPTQRRHDQKLNIERRSNVEALLAHVTGEPAPRPCKNCHKGHGPWTQCIVYDGQMCGSCTNCWFNASGSRCTFHENNHPQPQAMYAAPVATPAPGVMAYQSAATVPSTASINVAITAEMDHWGISEPTKQLITQAMGDVATFSRRDRFLARIEAAAKELGMRIAEYEDYLRTPEGMAEQATALERENGQGQDQDQDQDRDQNLSQEQDQTQATEASMGDAHSQDGVLP